MQPHAAEGGVTVDGRDGGRSGASSPRSSSHPPGPATTSARTSPPPCRSAFEASSSKTRSSPSRASSVEPDDTEGWAMRARRSDRTRETVCIVSSCQCQTSPGTEGTGGRPRVLGLDHRLPSRLHSRRGRFGPRPGSILTDRVPARREGAVPGLLPGTLCAWRRVLRELEQGRAGRRTLTTCSPTSRGSPRGASRARRPRPSPCSGTRSRSRWPTTATWRWRRRAAVRARLRAVHGRRPRGVLLRVGDMRTEERWPDYVAHVVAGDAGPQLAVGAAALPGAPRSVPSTTTRPSRPPSPLPSRCGPG